MTGRDFGYADEPESFTFVPPGSQFLFKGAQCSGDEETLLDCNIGELWEASGCQLEQYALHVSLHYYSENENG